MGSGGGGSSSGKTDFPDYMKTYHGRIMDDGGAVSPVTCVMEAYNVAVAGASPYANFVTNTDAILNTFGSSASTPFTKVLTTLKTMQDFDLQTTMNSRVAALVSSVSTTLDDEISLNILPKFRANMRGIGAVRSSAFTTGEVLIWDSKIKAMAKERVAIEELSLKIAVAFYDQKKSITLASADVIKYYHSLKTDIDNHYATMASDDLKWDLECSQYLNHTLAAISGAAVHKGVQKNQVGGAISGALSGAAMGAMMGSVVPGVGTAMGAMVGGAMGLAGSLASS